jgi:hypothetical protein
MKKKTLRFETVGDIQDFFDNENFVTPQGTIHLKFGPRLELTKEFWLGLKHEVMTSLALKSNGMEVTNSKMLNFVLWVLDEVENA